MSGFVGIDFGGAVKSVSGFRVVALLTIEIKEPQQGGAVIRLAIGSVELLGEKLQHLDRWPMAGNDVLHHGQESAAFPLAPLEMLELFGQGNGFAIHLRVEESADEVADLLDAGR